MTELGSTSPVGILGAGTMGTGIAQVAATAGHRVLLYDTSARALEKAEEAHQRILSRLVEKGRITAEQQHQALSQIGYTSSIDTLEQSGLVIEAILEDLGMKKAAFRRIEQLVHEQTILATNTSSLSITAIGSSCRRPGQLVGLHFFNPAPIMPLVEVVPGVLTDPAAIAAAEKLIQSWGKTTVRAKDTPGFIVNRVARPFYGEAIRLLEEDFSDAATIDWAMREIGGFKMGPFELMDLIGNDVNLTVTETVFEAFFYDPRFKPSFTQKRMVEAGLLGRKSGRGYYNYSETAQRPKPHQDVSLGHQIVDRIVALLINEAADAVLLKIASPTDIDLAMTRGVHYPKGLLRWANEIGIETVLGRLEQLHHEYGEDRYRPNPLLRRMVNSGEKFAVPE